MAPPAPEFEPRTLVTRDGRRVTLRPAADADAPALHALYADLARTSPHGVIEPDEVMPAARIGERLGEGARGGWLWLVLEAAPGELAGDAIVRPETFRRLAHNATFGLGLGAAWRGVGLGRALTDACLGWARAHPALRRVELQVFGDNAPAVALYASCGFAAEGLRPARVRVDGREIDEILMACDVTGPAPSEPRA